jgi:O-acetyl-ADP-ribose deacetylase (regulator of RNase III)
MTIQYLKGDATAPQAGGNKIIAHVCNIEGGWGAGFVLAISRKWPQPEIEYRRYCKTWKSRPEMLVGHTQLCQVAPEISVCNMFAQVLDDPHGVNIRYDWLKACLSQLARIEGRFSVHMPRIGCGLAGGRWEHVEPLINETLVAANIPVTVYDLPPRH